MSAARTTDAPRFDGRVGARGVVLPTPTGRVWTESARPQIAVLRSCRPAEFIAAVAKIRHAHPSADVVAISHAGHDETLRRAGVDAVIELPGRRFGPLRVAPARLWHIRRRGFSLVVVPQMTDDPFSHRNLYWFAVCLGAPDVMMLPLTSSSSSAPPVPDGPGRVLTTAALAKWLPWLSAGGALDRLDVPLLMLLLVVGRFWPRRAPTTASRELRILHVIPSLGLGGAQRQLASLIDQAPPDQRVDVVVFNQQDEFGRAWLRRADVRVDSLIGWPRLTAMALEISRRCREHRYDVVHTWLSVGNAVGTAGARLAGVPRVVVGERSLSLWKRTWYRQWWYRPVDALTARAADVVTVNARALADDHAAWTWTSRDRMTVVHNGLDPRDLQMDRADARVWLRREMGWPADAVVVGTVGRLAVEKDQGLLLQALAASRARFPTLRGLVVGEGPCEAELRSLAHRLGVTDMVAFAGARRDVPRVVAGLDVFVLPSIIEGFPNALLEAVLLEVPACASRVGGCADVLDDDGALLFEPEDAGSLARTLAHVLGHETLAHQRARRLRDRALGLFTAARVAARWHRLYDPSAAPVSGERDASTRST